ncbi:MAG: methyltransferase domain-containing protein [Acidobacteria bacterium]|nr:methyltransferase domain-containing protein [Acidobacteriota bacterium]
MKKVEKDFRKRSYQLERIDTGDYTPAEYDRFLREIRVVNKLAGDIRALKRSLLRDVRRDGVKKFSVLDVGAGAGELLRVTARFARRHGLEADLYGLELHERAARTLAAESKDLPEIKTIRGDVFALPFDDDSFDYALCSLFTHHFGDDEVVAIVREFARIARRRIYVIDLHRHPTADLLYSLFCAAFRISPLVREDGSLSIRRSFVAAELEDFAARAGLEEFAVERHFPFRLVLSGR